MTEVQFIATPTYTSDLFNEIPSFVEAQEGFHTQRGVDVLKNRFSKLILKHGVEEKFAIGLLHRHFTIPPKSKLVTFNNVSTPWTGLDEDNKIAGGIVLPCSWMIIGGGLVPCEFYFSPLAVDTAIELESPQNKAFLDDFVGLAKETSLDRFICLRTLEAATNDDGTLETTLGCANIVLEKNQAS